MTTESTKLDGLQYADRDSFTLDKAGGHYMRHVMAMTAEGLHAKSAIAGELAWRDLRIEQAEAEQDMWKRTSETLATHAVEDTDALKAERDEALARVASLERALRYLRNHTSVNPNQIGLIDETLGASRTAQLKPQEGA